ncbi:hypothetical protein IU437_30425 [Nocardia farcinica]|uniref:hypothetical protein n=1 Tax=Nocardia TaxID=1817 RepID=UPI00189309B4|nr:MULTISPECIES: hypothetical protein [Nocardia]MBF6216149.1 hypothetical protein [Nocardia puris]MBF6422927.1 hypothetical protein [Nocardia farcinica]
MTGTRDDADQRFFAALDRLHTRAGKPSAEHLSAVTTRVIGRTTPAKTIQGWLGEKGTDRVVPRKGRGYTCVIGYLLEKSDTPDREMVQAKKEWEQRREAAARATAANRKAAAIEVPAVSESVGVPIAQVEDPFALEVHELITADHAGQLPPLPPYVTRAHDERLAAVVQRAIGGESAIAVMLGGSSTGKTRALWEALALLPQSEWRLWHPRYPTRRQELVASLKNVGPHTVVWLNETQRFFSASAEEQEATANTLDAMLSDPRRAPILVLGSLWREHYAALCADPGSPARRLLNHETIIEVPAAFTGDDLAAMRLAAEQDPRPRNCQDLWIGVFQATSVPAC